MTNYSKVPDLPTLVSSDEPDDKVEVEVWGDWFKLRGSDTRPSLLVGLCLGLRWKKKVLDEDNNTLITKIHRPLVISGVLACRYSSITICTQLDSPLSAVVPRRLPERDSGSVAALKTACLWSWNCNASHDCIKEKWKLPTRVIELLSNDEQGNIRVRLRETSGERGNYLALSHCWGTSPRAVTTKANLESRKQSLDLAGLPKTFRDAIMIAQKLEIDFVWIDSLCIIQDNAEDWEREAARMGDVYARSFLTVSALAASDDSEGIFWGSHRADEAHDNSQAALEFFWKREWEDPNKPWIGPRAPWCVVNTSKGKSAQVWFCEKRYQQVHFGKMEKRTRTMLDGEPLTQRGWAFQERLLSPRLLHFGKGQMYWECQKILLYENGESYQAPKDELSVVIERHAQGIAIEWQNLVEKYSRRKLTFEHDKLPAIAGLARRIAEGTGDVYLAGLWKSQFLQGMSWTIPVSQSDHYAHRRRSSRPEQYRAPSWSWAAIDGEIEHWGFGDNTVYVAELIDCQIKARSGDPFGQVISAYAKVRGPVHEAQLLYIRKATSAGRLLIIKDGKHVVDGRALGDLNDNFSTCQTLFLNHEYALLLKPASNEEIRWGGMQDLDDNQASAYVRIGWASINSHPDRKQDMEYFCTKPESFKTILLL